MSRCGFMVLGNAYRLPGRCTKTKGLRSMAYQGRKVAACAHHRAPADAGRATLAVGAR